MSTEQNIYNGERAICPSKYPGICPFKKERSLMGKWEWCLTKIGVAYLMPRQNGKCAWVCVILAWACTLTGAWTF